MFDLYVVEVDNYTSGQWTGLERSPVSGIYS